ncbi:MAG: glycosyltransferase family 39 protein [Chloroflexi bacterium]|nr:glycosyltransferase family 39 protein [Chloroflexota bacterium]
MDHARTPGNKSRTIEVVRENATANAWSRPISWASLSVTVLIILIAFGLRVFRLDWQSLWYDEGVSVVMAQRDLLSITVNAAADIHPPLYYYLLHLWASLAGTTEFALRWLSMAFGVLLVAVAYKLGQKLFDSHVGRATALFAAIAPFAIYYSQEARMYMQVALLGGLSTYLLLSIQSDLKEAANGRKYLVRWGRILAYLLVSIALLYSHYFAFTILAFQSVAMLVQIVGDRGAWPSLFRYALWWIGLQVVIVLAFVPWLALTFAQIGTWPSISEPLSLEDLLARVFRVFTFGLSWDAALTPLKEDFFLLLLFCSTLALVFGRKRGLRSWCFAVLYCLIPVLIMYGLSLRKPMYNPKFLLLATPGYYLLLGSGLVSLGRLSMMPALWQRFPFPRLRVATGTVLVAVLLFGVTFSISRSMSAYYFDAKYARDNYRGLADFILSRANAGDGIVLNAPGQVEIFGYYFKGKQAIYPLPTERPIDKQKTETALESLIAKHKHIWLVLWAQTESDPDGFVERWLDENSFKASNSWFGSVRLAHYTVAGDAAAASRIETDLTFGEKIALKGISVGSSSAKPGDILEVTLFWEASRPIEERYTVFLHVLDDDEYLWGQRDSEPGGGNRPTIGWVAGETVTDRHGVTVLPGTPPGIYRFEVGLYRPADGRRLSIEGGDGQAIGDRFLFGRVEIAQATSPPKPVAVPIQNRSAASFGSSLRLLGFDFHRLGQPVSDVDFRAGDLALATLYWEAGERIVQDYVVKLEILDREGTVKLQHSVQPHGGKYPTSRWSAGELVRDQHKLSLADFGPEEYILRLGVLDAGNGNPVATKSDGPGPGGVAELLRFRVR